MATERKVVLTKPQDWDSWIYLIQMRAQALRVWEKINPDINSTTIHFALEEPEAPMMIIPVDGFISQDQLNTHKALKENYKTSLAKFEKETNGFLDIISLIQGTVSVSNMIYIEGLGANPYHSLVALKSKLAPTTQAREMEIEQDYHRLNKGPGKGDLDKWINDWIKTYNKLKQFDIFETNNDRPVRDFLIAITNVNPVFTMNKLIEMTETKDTLNVLDTIEVFRNVTRLTKNSKAFNSTHIR